LFRIVVARAPHRGAATLPGVARPGLVAWLPGAWDRVRLPEAVPGLGVERLHETADAALAARHADYHLALDHEWRERDVVAGRRVLDLFIPDDLSREGVEGDHVGVERPEVHVVTPE